VTLTILEGTTFCICDNRGDVGDETSGFFADDTRYLSVFRLTIDGRRPLLLTSDKVEYYSAAFFLRNAPTETPPQDTLSIARFRFVGDAMQDRVTLQNQGSEPVSFQLALEIASDFADIFTVKSYDFSFGDPLQLPPAGAGELFRRSVGTAPPHQRDRQPPERDLSERSARTPTRRRPGTSSGSKARHTCPSRYSRKYSGRSLRTRALFDQPL
jgi:glycogen debranching enzyme